MEWFFETINKRLGPPYNVALDDLFACIPYAEEAEFEYELLSMFKYAERKLGISQGAALAHDYPNIAKLAKSSNKILKIRIFFVHPSRLHNNLILNHKKYPYPKVNQKIKNLAFDLSNTDVNLAYKEHRKREAILNKLSN